MAALAESMPRLDIPLKELAGWGQLWLGEVNPQTGQPKSPNAFDRQQSVNFAQFIDREFARCLAVALGGISVQPPNGRSLLPPAPDCVEVGAVRVIGGVRPQNYDVAYRPDGPRVVFDSKTLNDEDSIRKNWQNMINDLATEATTVHIRFPYAIVAFLVMVPAPALADKQEFDIIRTLERLATRKDVLDQAHLAEAVSLVVWHPASGKVHPDIPPKASPLRVEQLSASLFPHYLERYKGLPPHSEE
jgi:hypothetical protein